MVADLKDRPRDVVLQRFGIGASSKRKTLEAIGNDYGITRERVRQIENFALNAIRQSDNFASARDVFEELKNAVAQKGWLVSENDILDYLAADEQSKNHLYFLLVLGDDFVKMKEDDEFCHRWTVDEDRAKNIHQVLRRLHKEVGDDDLIPEQEIIVKIRNHAQDALGEKIAEEIIRSWLGISKIIGVNSLGEWGSMNSTSIRPRGMRDLAFLVLRKQGSPMHFNEVAKTISEFFPKKAHPATVHNELIKDPRFVLVGRGLYALGEWGYNSGTVRDVIKNILKSERALSKEDLINRVLKERYVKENTILVNLQNRRYFKRDPKGNYILA